MNYSTFIFDFDYTLADATNGIVDCFHYAFDKMNIPRADREEIRLCIGMTLADSLTRLTGIDDKDKTDLFLDLYREEAERIMTANTVMLSGAKETLIKLHKSGKRLGIVTTKRRIRIEQTFEIEGLTDSVSVIVGGDDVSSAKPDPSGLLYAIKALGEEKEHVLYVGDSVIDAMTALNAGVDFCAVLTGTTKKETFLKYPYKYIFDSVAGLIDFNNIYAQN